MGYVLIVCGWSELSSGFNTAGHFPLWVESKFGEGMNRVISHTWYFLRFKKSFL